MHCICLVTEGSIGMGLLLILKWKLLWKLLRMAGVASTNMVFSFTINFQIGLNLFIIFCHQTLYTLSILNLSLKEVFLTKIVKIKLFYLNFLKIKKITWVNFNFWNIECSLQDDKAVTCGLHFLDKLLKMLSIWS